MSTLFAPVLFDIAVNLNGIFPYDIQMEVLTSYFFINIAHYHVFKLVIIYSNSSKYGETWWTLTFSHNSSMLTST